MKQPLISIIPIKGGYKWRIRRYTDNPINNYIEGIFEYPSALEATKGLQKYLEFWEPVWNRIQTVPKVSWWNRTHVLVNKFSRR